MCFPSPVVLWKLWKSKDTTFCLNLLLFWVKGDDKLPSSFSRDDFIGNEIRSLSWIQFVFQSMSFTGFVVPHFDAGEVGMRERQAGVVRFPRRFWLLFGRHPLCHWSRCREDEYWHWHSVGFLGWHERVPEEEQGLLASPETLAVEKEVEFKSSSVSEWQKIR